MNQVGDYSFEWELPTPSWSGANPLKTTTIDGDTFYIEVSVNVDSQEMYIEYIDNTVHFVLELNSEEYVLFESFLNEYFSGKLFDKTSSILIGRYDLLIGKKGNRFCTLQNRQNTTLEVSFTKSELNYLFSNFKY
jgi:hypothetical protein